MARHRKPRRGVVLLLVLSLLVLFLLIGVTFLVISSQFLRGAKAQAKQGQRGSDPRGQLEGVLYQLLRDTSIRSSIQGHGLLEDLYGHDAYFETVQSASFEMPANTPPASGQFMRITFTPSPGATADYSNGRVLTMLNGPAANLSARIVDFDGASGILRTEALESDQTGARPLPATGDTFLVNGQPFNGTGAGYNPTTRNIDRRALDLDGDSNPDVPLALMPHFVAYTTGADANQGPNGFSAREGGADESYDAVDFQNMFLAMVPPSATNSNEIIPSFHRPSLVNYWFNWIYTNILDPIPLTDPVVQRATVLQPYGPDQTRLTADDPVDDSGTAVPIAILDAIMAMKRAFMFRPLPEDHPNFTGSNPFFTQLIGAGISGAYDVDNDNDGIPDSIWIDAGLPVTTLADGTLAKPLVAVLIKDLDGRLNLNTHGNLAHTVSNYSIAVTGNFAGGSTSLTLPRGRGLGPAEVFLGRIFGGSEHAAILQGRYGPDGGNSQPGIPTVNDDISMLRTIGMPATYSTQLSSYASPPDVWGRDALALDLDGQPLFASIVDPTIGEPNSSVDDPYELNLSPSGLTNGGTVDRPYTLAELEPLLRAFDGDSNSLPSRIVAAAPTGTASQRNRGLVTVESRDIPVGSQYEPVELRGSFSASAATILDLYTRKLTTGGATNIPAQLERMVPWEIRRGGRFNINRWLGDGRDNNANGVVDEPAEAAAGEQMWNGLGLPSAFNTAAFDHLNSGHIATPLITNRRFARQIYARHLYCLMRVLVDGGFVSPVTETTLTAAQQSELTARRIAQWAINVVDFRDADGIMSPFEYDVNPFNGWLPMDGNPATDEANDGVDNDGDTAIDETDEKERRVVWGCEYPDLLLSEIISLHDRRVADTDDDDNDRDKRQKNGTKTDEEGDNDLDQIRIPEGSLFFEVYCTRNRSANNPRLPRELYNAAGQLDLGRVAPVSVDTLRYPVWRVAISERPSNKADSALERSRPAPIGKPDSTSFDPTNMTLLPGIAPQPLAIERVVWFAPLDPGDPATVARAQNTFYSRVGTVDLSGPVTDPAESNVTLLPGRYAVVGPRTTTYVGSKKPADPTTTFYEPSLHRIDLIPTALNVIDTDGVSRYPEVYPTVATGTIQQPLGIIAAAKPPIGWSNPSNSARTGIAGQFGIGINVSEPLPQSANYYREPGYSHIGGTQLDAYDELDPSLRANRIPDRPFDNDPALPLGRWGLLATGTDSNFKTAFLQRLANPLEPYHPTSNPYITIDWSAIDLTVFNGEDRKPTGWTLTVCGAAKDWDPSDPDPFDLPDVDPVRRFATRERGLRRFTQATDDPTIITDDLIFALFPPNPANAIDDRLWPHDSYDPTLTPSASGHADNYFRYGLIHTLGYLNRTMGDPQPAPASYIGGPPQPFPWLNWNNRPFDTPFELMQVPASSPSRLLFEFDLASSFNPYGDPSNPVDSARAPFQRLLNFFHTSSVAGQSPHFYRLFDYVETPSPFVATETWYNPGAAPHFGGAGAGVGADGFRPPYDRFPTFRDPGRVNINTIFDPLIWQGIMYGLDMSPSFNAIANWNQVVVSRQGYGTSPGINNALPTRFAGPFRSATSGYLAPIPALAKDGVQATLLRSKPNPTSPADAAKPLFDFTSGSTHQHTNRNPYFRYQAISRLGNLVTTRSNVFAIWITVGYFEVDAVPVNAFHPEGYEFGQEAGSLTGNVQRHRLFSIVDRSIPVAYERGENRNVDRAILVRRLIE